jgi:GT2 family glycosyltransferase
LRLAVGIATKGRAGILAETLAGLARQSRPPDRLLICHTAPEDVAGLAESGEFILAPASTTLQRNVLMDAAADCELMVFLDDDVVLDPAYLAATERAFLKAADIVVTTGTLLADGAKGPGLSHADAARLLDGCTPDMSAAPLPAFNGYGCNMAVRLDAVRAHGLRFDERMTFYAWYEDLDFTRRLGGHGRIVRLPGAVGVHLGVKLGRVSGARLGYAQMVNPVYLAAKGSYPWSHALRSVARHLAMNALRAWRPEPYVDRRGRLRGNLAGLADLLRGVVSPERVRLM